MTSRRIRPLCLLCAASGLFLFLVATPTQAQAPRNPTDVIAQGTAYYIFAEPGEATIELLVLGSATAGVYVVGETTTLTELLALSGGVGQGEQSASVDIDRTVRLLREQGGQRTILYEAEVDEMLRSPNAHPALMDGDMLTVETKARNRFRLLDTLSIVTSLTTVTLLVLRLVDASN